MTSLSSSIVRSLAYSHVFSYPLRLDEVRKGMDHHCKDVTILSEELENLKLMGIVHQEGPFYSISKDKQQYKKRNDRNTRAIKYLKWAYRISRFIGSFPFVRAVFLSGSISKNSMDKDSDIDYFIITEPGKLWLTRSLLILFKKIFLFNSYKFFCLNYFVDSNNMVITDRNIYVAHEITTLIPTYGKSTCEEFFKANAWVKEFLPNSTDVVCDRAHEGKIRWFKYLAEKVLDNGFGGYLEKKFQRITKDFWHKKFKNKHELDMTEIALFEDHLSTHHPNNFKHVILNRSNQIISHLEKEFSITLSE